MTRQRKTRGPSSHEAGGGALSPRLARTCFLGPRRRWRKQHPFDWESLVSVVSQSWAWGCRVPIGAEDAHSMAALCQALAQVEGAPAAATAAWRENVRQQEHFQSAISLRMPSSARQWARQLYRSTTRSRADAPMRHAASRSRSRRSRALTRVSISPEG